LAPLISCAAHGADDERGMTSDLKLPRIHSARHAANENPWLAADIAERRKPVIVLACVVGIFTVGVVMIMRGLAV
jgi:hypothetical protein